MVLWGAAAPQGQREKAEPSDEDTQPTRTDAPLSNEHPSTVTTPEDTDDKRLIARDTLTKLREYVDSIQPLETR